jgi:lysophospholipase L1-like esterase
MKIILVPLFALGSVLSILPSAAQAPAQTRQLTITWPQPQPPAGQGWATFPVPRLDWWIARFESNVDKLKDGPYDLIFDGDSITDNWYNDPESRKVWDQRYGALKALDLGIGGDQVQHVLWRVQNGSLAGQDPKLIVSLIGTNNISQKEEDVAAGIKALMGEYEKRCPDAHILSLGIFPRDPKPESPARTWIAQVNKLIAANEASDPRITYLDIGAKFLQPDGSIAYDVMRDGLHPSPKGYVIWADAIQPVIDKYVSKPAGK